jgi:hypothetical protein
MLPQNREVKWWWMESGQQMEDCFYSF